MATEELARFLTEKAEGDAISIVNVKGGAVVDMADRAIDRALQNINDINTTLDVREITIKITLKPSEDRTFIEYGALVRSKLAGQEGIKGTADVRINEQGKAFGRERGRKQAPLFSNVTPMTRKES